MGTATFTLSSFAAAEAASEEAAVLEAAELAVEEEPPHAVRAAPIVTTPERKVPLQKRSEPKPAVPIFGRFVSK